MSLRTPPLGSLADDILKTNHPQLQRVQAMMSDVKDSLSDFRSCLGSSSSSSESENSADEKFKTVARKEGGKKRKNSLTPSKNYFLKKQSSIVSNFTDII